MPLDDLKHAARVLQRFVSLRRRFEQRADERLEWRALGGDLLGFTIFSPGGSRGLVSAGRRLFFADLLLAAARGVRRPSLCLSLGAGILPTLVVVLADEAVVGPFAQLLFVLHESGKHAVQIFGVLKLVAYKHRRIG